MNFTLNLRKYMILLLQTNSFSKVGDKAQWIQRQLRDPFNKKRRIESFRCRSAFKLIEIDNKYNLLFPGITLLECGAAPGSWSQVISRRCVEYDEDNSESKTLAIAVDLQHIVPVPGIHCLSECDLMEPTTRDKIIEILGDKRCDLILSDMAPNVSGIKDIDTIRMEQLNEMTLKLGLEMSKPGGNILVKTFDSTLSHILPIYERFYEFSKLIKPVSSRTDSSETFLMCFGCKKK